MMRKYKVVAGVHIEDGREYGTGEIVTSDRNLSQLFREKFEDLGPVGQQTPEPEPEPEEEEDDDEWKTVKKSTRVRRKG